LKKVFIVLLSLLLGLIGLVLVLAGTEGGTQWLAGQARRWSGGDLAWETLQGSLFGPLQLQGLRLRQEGLAVDVQALTLAWQPGALLGGRLQVDELLVEGLRIAMPESTESPPPEQPFRPADLQPPLDVWLQDITIRDLQLILGGGPARQVDEIGLAARLENGVLQLERLEVRAPEGGLTATGEAELSETLALRLELAWDWRLPDQRRVGGQLQAHGDASSLAVDHTGSGDVPISLHGEFRDILDDPGWEVDVGWPALSLAGGEEPLLVGPGQIRSSGNLESFQITSDGRIEGAGLEPSQWSLQGQGDSAGLQLSPLTLLSPPGYLELAGRLDWSGPLAVDLDYRARGDQLTTVHPDLPPGLEARGRLQGQYLGEELTLEQLTVALEQSPLRLDLHGTVQLPAGGEPAFDGRLQWSGLQWPLLGADPAFASPQGSLDLAGTADAYQAGLSVQVAGSQVPPGDWQGQGSGDRGGLQLQRLHGTLLDGEVSLSGFLGWDPVATWTLQVAGDGLDPGQWLPALPGRLTLALRSAGRIDPDQGIQGGIELEQLVGNLADRDLDLSASASLAGEIFTVEALRLNSDGNRFTARGQLSPALALEWELQAPSPGALLPGLDGRLAARGRLAGSPAQPRLQARLSGEDLLLETRSLPRLTAELEVGLGADDPLQLDLESGPLYQGEQLLLQSAHVLARGQTSNHWLELDLQTTTDQLSARLEGGLDPALAVWNGHLAKLGIESGDYGVWQLVEPASLTLAAAMSQLGETCLQALEETTRLCARGDWRELEGASLVASLAGLPLERLLSNVSGELSGQLDAGLAADGALRARAALDMSPGQVRVELQQGLQRLAHGGGQLDLTIDPDGLAAVLQFEPLAQGLVQAELRLPELHHLPLPERQPLEGRIQVELPDLSGLQAWVPELAATAGRLDADLRLAGSLDQPLVLGELALVDGAADIPLAGLQLRQAELRASGDPDHPGQLALAGGLVSGPGRVDIEGRLDLPGNAFELSLRGDRLQIYDTPDGSALASPDLQIAWSDAVLKLRGRVFIPEASITPRLGLRPSLVTEDPAAADMPGQIILPSSDVVVLGGEKPAEVAAPPASFRLDNQVELILGDRVSVNALGFISRIAGAVTFTNTPDQAGLIPTAQGKLSIEDGTFRAFGQDLEIETGQVIFAGVPATEPELNLRAVRWIDSDAEVSAAGVLISGPATEPLLELFSRPQLDPGEVQSYLLTGRSTSGQDSVLSIGTYLNPKTYVGYGYNLLESTSQFNTLYTITPRYGVEASVGEADNTVGLTFTYEH
jgi:autotransporter translocation and assembly factor TamB